MLRRFVQTGSETREQGRLLGHLSHERCKCWHTTDDYCDEILDDSDVSMSAVQQLPSPAKMTLNLHADGEGSGVPTRIVRPVVKQDAQDHGCETGNNTPKELAFPHTYTGTTYSAAVMKMNKTGTFFLFGRCSLRIMGIGSMKMYKSKTTTRMPCTKPQAVSLLHLKPTAKSHGSPGWGAQK